MTVRVAAEDVLGNQRIDTDQNAVGERERIDDQWSERQRPRTDSVGRDPRQRDRQENLLPGLDRRERAAANSRAVQGRAHGVVEREPDDPQVQRRDRPEPDGYGCDEEEDRVDPERDHHRQHDHE